MNFVSKIFFLGESGVIFAQDLQYVEQWDNNYCNSSYREKNLHTQ